MLLKLFSVTIIPILLYNCEIWGPYLLGKINSFEIFKSKIFKVINEIERFHLKFCKHILGVHSKTTNIAIFAELGRIPLLAQISLHIVKYCLHIKDASFDKTLAGKAAQLCMDMNLQPAIFTDYLLKMCKIDVGNFKQFTVLHDTQGNFWYIMATNRLMPLKFSQLCCLME